jgi:hypothetical protein
VGFASKARRPFCRERDRLAPVGTLPDLVQRRAREREDPLSRDIRGNSRSPSAPASTSVTETP